MAANVPYGDLKSGALFSSCHMLLFILLIVSFCSARFPARANHEIFSRLCSLLPLLYLVLTSGRHQSCRRATKFTSHHWGAIYG